MTQWSGGRNPGRLSVWTAQTTVSRAARTSGQNRAHPGPPEVGQFHSAVGAQHQDIAGKPARPEFSWLGLPFGSRFTTEAELKRGAREPLIAGRSSLRTPQAPVRRDQTVGQSRSRCPKVDGHGLRSLRPDQALALSS